MATTAMWNKCVAISWALLGAIHLSDSFSVVPSRLNGLRSRCSSPRRHHGPLFSSKDKKNLSAAAKERREEEKRRLERKTDVVIGRTSALPDAQDYLLDPTATEQEWMRQASSVEQEIFRHTEKGMRLLKMLQLEEAVTEFDQVFTLRSNAYLWQAGIAKFYLDDLESAADIFVKNVATYESKFGIPASEERIWRDACELKLATSLGKTEKKVVEESGGVSKMIAQIPTRDENDTPLPTETRKVLRIARELFAATLEENHVTRVLARAKLRSISGAYDDQPRVDRKMWKLTAWFYLGLHYDVVGDMEESRECMKMALRLCPNGNADDIIHILPLLHMSRRDLFDDDEFEEAPPESLERKEGRSSSASVRKPMTSIRTDPVFIESIQKSISRMSLAELQAALRARGLKFHDSKRALGEKLFRSLVEDSGLDI